MRSIALTAFLLAGCVHPARFEDMRHRAEAAEAETLKTLTFLAGAQQDNAMLQKGLIEQEMQLRSLVGGMQIQAQITADMRRSCDL